MLLLLFASLLLSHILFKILKALWPVAEKKMPELLSGTCDTDESAGRSGVQNGDSRVSSLPWLLLESPSCVLNWTIWLPIAPTAIDSSCLAKHTDSSRLCLTRGRACDYSPQLLAGGVVGLCWSSPDPRAVVSRKRKNSNHRATLPQPSPSSDGSGP